MSHSDDSPIHLVIHDQPLDTNDDSGPESSSMPTEALLTENKYNNEDAQRRNGNEQKQQLANDNINSQIPVLVHSSNPPAGSDSNRSSDSTPTPTIFDPHAAAASSSSLSRLKNVQQHLIDLSGPRQDGSASTSRKGEYFRPLPPRSSITPSTNSSNQPKSNSHSSRRVQFHTPVIPPTAVDVAAIASDPLLIDGTSEEDSPVENAAAEKELKDALISLYQPKPNTTNGTFAKSADALVSPSSIVAQKNVTPTNPNTAVVPAQSKEIASAASNGNERFLSTTDSRATLHKSANSASSLGNGSKRALTPTNPLHVSLRTSAKFRRAILILCLMAVTVVAITMALCFHQLAQIQSSLHEFQNSENISNYTSSLLEALLNGETGTRGYQLTGMPLFLQPYNDSLITVPLFYDQLAATVSPTDFHVNALNELTFLIANISAQWSITIQDRADPVDGFAKSVNDTFSLNGKGTMDAIRDVLSSLRDVETEVVHQRYNDTNYAVVFMTVATAVSMSLIVVTVCAGGWIGVDADSKGLRKHNEQLTVLLQKAEESTKLKSVFLASMSHEIRTPMNGVLSMTRYLATLELNEEQHEVVDTILTSAESMMRLIDDLLLFSKMEAGKFRLCPINFPLATLLKPLDDIFSIRIASKQLVGQPIYPDAVQLSPVKWVMQVDENLPQKIFADNDRLRQILTNLLDNAVKFTQEGSITLRVSLLNANAMSSRRPVASGAAQKNANLSSAISRFFTKHGIQNPNDDGSKPPTPPDGISSSSRQQTTKARSPFVGPAAPHQSPSQTPSFTGSETRAKLAMDQTPFGSPDLNHRTLSVRSNNNNPPVTASPQRGPLRLHQRHASNDRTDLLNPPRSSITASVQLTPLRPPMPSNNVATQFVYLRFSVTDTGIGIDPAVHKAIFEPFQQADMSTTRLYGGSGLGLSICSQLVAQMGGRLKLHSALGEGSTFYFTLRVPVVPEDEEEEEELDLDMEDDDLENEMKRKMDETLVNASSSGGAIVSNSNMESAAASTSPPNEVVVGGTTGGGGGTSVTANATHVSGSSLDLTSMPRFHDAPTPTPPSVAGAADSSSTSVLHNLQEPAPIKIATTNDMLQVSSSAAAVPPLHPVLSFDSSPHTTSQNFTSSEVQPLLNRIPSHPSASPASVLQFTPTTNQLLQSTPSSSSSAFASPPSAPLASVAESPDSGGSGANEIPPATAPAAFPTANALSASVAASMRLSKKAGNAPNSGGKSDGVNSSLHVLIAEDNAINVKVLTKLLSREGHTVSVANNGLEAVEMYRAAPNKYQLIVMDLHMPVMDGLEATMEIRSTEQAWNQAAGIPVHTNSSSSSGSAQGSRVPSRLVPRPLGVPPPAVSNTAAGLQWPSQSAVSYSAAGASSSAAAASSSGSVISQEDSSKLGKLGYLPPIMSHSSSSPLSSTDVTIVSNGSPSTPVDLTAPDMRTLAGRAAAAGQFPPAVATSSTATDATGSSAGPNRNSLASGSGGSGGSGGKDSSVSHSSSGSSSKDSVKREESGAALAGATGHHASSSSSSRLSKRREIHIPIIACTASAMDADASNCRAAGMDDVLTKPVSITELQAKLKHVSTKWVQAQRRAAAAAAAHAAGVAHPIPHHHHHHTNNNASAASGSGGITSIPSGGTISSIGSSSSVAPSSTPPFASVTSATASPSTLAPSQSPPDPEALPSNSRGGSVFATPLQSPTARTRSLNASTNSPPDETINR